MSNFFQKMSNFLQKTEGFNVKELSFVPVYPSYFPPGYEFPEQEVQYENDKKILVGWIANEDGCFITLCQSDNPLNDRQDKKMTEETIVRIKNVEVVIHRKPWKSNEYKSADEDKREMHLKWQDNGIYFRAITNDVPLNEVMNIISSMIKEKE